MTSHPHGFNLIDQAGIPVLDLDGVVRERSILDTLALAGQSADIVAEVPTQAFAITRLLLAVIHRAIRGPVDVEHWLQVRDQWLQAEDPPWVLQVPASRYLMSWHYARCSARDGQSAV